LIKLLSLLVKRPEISSEEFRQNWATDVAAAFREWKNCARYVQYDLQPEKPNPPAPALLDMPLDGIDEIWVNLSSPADVTSDLHKIYQVAARYVGAIKILVFDERPVKNILTGNQSGNGLLKRLVPLVRKDGWTHEQFAQHWRDVHAPLAKALKPGARRYHQLYVVSEIAPPLGIAEIDVRIDGFSESWFADEGEMNMGKTSPEGIALAADNQIYLQKSKRFFFDEREIVSTK
jgi:uncharacterized protein (TIGR02118 family)